MKTYTAYISALLLLAAAIPAHAQWYNDGAKTNSGGHLSDGSQQGINTTTGVYATTGSTGSPEHYGVFEHRGQSGTGPDAAFINDGAYDASVNGRDYFMGPGGTAGQQEIAGSAMPVFGELFIQNGATQEFNITNTNGIRIAANVSFENGITTTVRDNTTAGAIKLDDEANYSNTALGANQHVNGYVTKTGNDPFVFPVGSGSEATFLMLAEIFFILCSFNNSLSLRGLSGSCFARSFAFSFINCLVLIINSAANPCSIFFSCAPVGCCSVVDALCVFIINGKIFSMIN